MLLRLLRMARNASYTTAQPIDISSSQTNTGAQTAAKAGESRGTTGGVASGWVGGTGVGGSAVGGGGDATPEGTEQVQPHEASSNLPSDTRAQRNVLPGRGGAPAQRGSGKGSNARRMPRERQTVAKRG